MPRPVSGRRRLVRSTLLALGCLPILLLTLGFCVGTPHYYHKKFAAVPGGVRPTALPNPIQPEVQTEPHTCGLHSLSSLYHAYGLNPEERRLRFRLGTDKPINNWIPDTRGTIHPDMLRVLGQDGFDAEVLLPGSQDTLGRLRAHLDAGHFAVVLIKPSEFHWVVAAARDGDNALICDSQRRDLYPVPMESYLRDEVYSLMLVRPAADE
ncbi:hypothetical protein MNBD_PLANCTO03-1223 [hydrothermal vent metagenome]|uniref:Peptidase C39 domain-containing protein n=1 Tax=hydrothermal vent metagenome TaxID=652676 RepID=A0A3B1DAZ2_9ZZZZ